MPTLPPLSFCLPVEPEQGTCPPGAIPADLLFRGSQEILIVHNGETYRLRITRNGKLILTK
jgi:hemin uptake protein HemP